VYCHALCREAIARLNEENEAFVSTYDQQVQQLAAVAGRLEETRAAEEDQRAKRGQLEALAAQQAQMLGQLEEGAAKVGAAGGARNLWCCQPEVAVASLLA
jgi:hypothetical protein